MLSDQQRELYITLQQQLSTIEDSLDQADMSLGITQEVADLQRFFRMEIAALPIEGVDATAAHRIQSYQVEISKQLRLLGVDVSFWVAARQADTRETRRGQVRQRLQILSQYCDRLLERLPDETPHQG